MSKKDENEVVEISTFNNGIIEGEITIHSKLSKKAKLVLWDFEKVDYGNGKGREFNLFKFKKRGYKAKNYIIFTEPSQQ